MSYQRGTDPTPAEPLGGRGRVQHVRQDVRVGHLALGTIACPGCDAPVVLQAGSASPADRLSCPVCGHAGHVRDFLTLASPGHPARPARVEVRVVRPGRFRVERA